MSSPTSTPPTSLDAALLKSMDPVLEPFAKKEFQHAAVYAFLYLYISLSTPPTTNITFLLRSAIPMGSGLGSSASISVCLATALLTLGGHIPKANTKRHDGIDAGEVDVDVLKVINDWAYVGEKCIHGNPSGVDNTVATFGGGVVFRKERRERKLSNGTFTSSKPAEKIIIRYLLPHHVSPSTNRLYPPFLHLERQIYLQLQNPHLTLPPNRHKPPPPHSHPRRPRSKPSAHSPRRDTAHPHCHRRYRRGSQTPA